MNVAAPSGGRRRTARIAHVTGDVCWWIFVVGRLMCELGLTMGGLPRRYADYGDNSLFGVGLGTTDFGWTAYTPLTNDPPSGLGDPFVTANVVSWITIVALALVILAAVIEAVTVRRWPAGIGTILAPVIGAAIILVALYERAGYLGGGRLELSLLVVFALVLLGIAVREVWSRVLAPTVSPTA